VNDGAVGDDPTERRSDAMTERGSTQHGPRIDEEMKSETASLVHGAPVESRVQPWRQMEPAGEEDPEPDALPARDEIEARSTLAVSLRPSAFPGDRARLIGMAQAENATEEVMSWLDRLPAGVTFANVQDVWDALGGTHEQREHILHEDRAPADETTASPDPDAIPAEAPEDRADDRSLLELGTTIATEAAGLMLGAAAFVFGAVCESARAIARRVQGSSG
jgi:hypothetical protein